MLEQIKNEFSRYFFMTSQARGVAAAFGFSMFMRDKREILSELIPQKLYLGNLPRQQPFSSNLNIPDIKDAALVVSCMDISELAESRLLLEPSSHKITYHVVAMKDVSGETGNSDQIYDALQLMSEFAAAKKPIHIHCYSGVGRSAMMAAMHLAHRYLLKDPVICDLFDAVNPKLKSDFTCEDTEFIQCLYNVSCRYVSSARQCCQFDNRERLTIALSTLSRINSEINQGQLTGLPHSEHYAFIAELVQSASFKKLHYEYYKFSSQTAFYIDTSQQQATRTPVNLQKNIKDFFDDLLLNKEGWFQQLKDIVIDNPIKLNHNHLELFCISQLEGLASDKQEDSMNERRELLVNLHDTIYQLAIKYPETLYSQSVIKFENKDYSIAYNLNI